jgi:uncharacterized membrane protein HdeD (DUF308 family)
MELMLIGAIMMASFTASLFFLRFWKTTGDRFFLFFAVSFGLEGIVRIMLALAVYPNQEERPSIYIIRLIAFSLILLAIIDKNWVQKRRAPGQG